MTSKLSDDAKAYYEGGHRVTIGGVPCRVARKPTKNMMAILRDAKPHDPVAAQIAASNIERPGFTYRAPDEKPTKKKGGRQ